MIIHSGLLRAEILFENRAKSILRCRRFIAPPISRRDMLARFANGFGAVALAALLGEKGYGADMADFPEDLSKWTRTQPAEKDGRYWLRANNDIQHEWTVFLRSDRPSARLEDTRWPANPPLPFEIEKGTAKEGLAGRRFRAKVSDGWIVGFNAGEWGGALWWFSPDGKERYKISEDQVIQFIETDAGLLALDGIAHGGISRGQIVRLAKGQDKFWHAEQFLDLAGAPMAAVKDANGALLVTTFDRLLRVDPSSKMAFVLVRDAFWGDLYPTSMICTPKGTIYIGMRHGVAEVLKDGEFDKVNWLIPDAEYDRADENRAPGFR